jgi:hypothetical protein
MIVSLTSPQNVEGKSTKIQKRRCQMVQSLKSLGSGFFLAALVISFTLVHGMVTEVNAGIIIGASRASTSSGCLQAKESVTWDQQMGVVNRERWTDSYHWNWENGAWSYKHLVRSGWQWGWTTGNAAAHYWGTDNFSSPGVVGYHHTYIPSKGGIIYHGRTEAVNQCWGGERRFMYDDGR